MLITIEYELDSMDLTYKNKKKFKKGSIGILKSLLRQTGSMDFSKVCF